MGTVANVLCRLLAFELQFSILLLAFLAFFMHPCIGDSGDAADGKGKPAALAPEKAGWEVNFDIKDKSLQDKKIIPENWELRGKPGTPKAEFYLVYDENEKKSFLHMNANKASASLIGKVDGINLADFPVISWKWRVIQLPKNGDGRDPERDDQAIGLYVGSGSFLSKRSISYRWDTETPKDSTGECSYVVGTLKVKWFTLRDKNDGGEKDKSEWMVETRNWREDYKKAWGEYPEDIHISISSNSQGTGSETSADIEWIKLLPASAMKD